MLTGLVFLFVGSVLFLNGIWIMGHIEDREISVINVFVGTLTLLVAVYLAFGPQADADSIKTAAFTLLFTFTVLLGGVEPMERCRRARAGLVLLFCRGDCHPDNRAGLCRCFWHPGLLVGSVLGFLGGAVAHVLGAVGSAKADCENNRLALRDSGGVHGMATGIPAAGRGVALNTAASALRSIVCPAFIFMGPPCFVALNVVA